MKSMFTSLFFSLPGRYAKALLESSEESFHEDFERLLKLFDHDPSFQLLTDSHYLNKKPVLKFIDVLSQNFSFKKQFSNFLKILVQKNRFTILNEIYRCYKTLWNCKHNQKSIEVTSVIKLEKKEIETIQKLLKKYFSQQLNFTFKVDPLILGGILIETGTHRIDASILSQIQLIRESLISL